MTALVPERDALLASIVANPDEDTPRLMYADALQEQDAPWVACPECSPYYPGRVYESAGPDSRWVECEHCSGTGQIRDTSAADLAEFVRVQVELAKFGPRPPSCTRTGAKMGRDCPGCLPEILWQDATEQLRDREDALLAEHRVAWSRWACPNPGRHRKEYICQTCGRGEGDLFHGLAVEFRRGFPWRVTAPTLSVWVEEETVADKNPKAEGRRVDCPHCGYGYWQRRHPNITPEYWALGCETCLGTGRMIVRPAPSPRLAAVATHTTVAEVLAADREPYHNAAGCWLWHRAGAERSELPEPLFMLLADDIDTRNRNSWRTYRTRDLALSALGRALVSFGKGKPSEKGHVRSHGR